MRWSDHSCRVNFVLSAGHRQHTARARARARTHDRRQARTSGQRVACDAHDVRVLAGTETIQRTVSARAAIPRVLFENVGEIIPGHPVPPCDARFGRCVASLHAAAAGAERLLLSHFMARSLADLDNGVALVRERYPGEVVLADDLACVSW